MALKSIDNRHGQKQNTKGKKWKEMRNNTKHSERVIHWFICVCGTRFFRYFSFVLAFFFSLCLSSTLFRLICVTHGCAHSSVPVLLFSQFSCLLCTKVCSYQFLRMSDEQIFRFHIHRMYKHSSWLCFLIMCLNEFYFVDFFSHSIHIFKLSLFALIARDFLATGIILFLFFSCNKNNLQQSIKLTNRLILFYPNKIGGMRTI